MLEGFELKPFLCITNAKTRSATRCARFDTKGKTTQEATGGGEKSQEGSIRRCLNQSRLSGNEMEAFGNQLILLVPGRNEEMTKRSNNGNTGQEEPYTNDRFKVNFQYTKCSRCL